MKKLLSLLSLLTLATALAGDTTGTFDLGTKVTMKAIVDGGVPPFKYQWKKQNELGVFVDLAGQTTDAVLFAALKLTDVGTYTVTVSNPSGSVTANNYGVIKVKVTAPGKVTITFEPAGA